MTQKKFKLFDAILTAVCVVLVVEASAPAAAIGNSQFFWWVFLLICFFVPYGLISAELGTTYEDEGGIYDWVKRAFGMKWGSRVAWYYYINFPLWMGSLAVLFTDILAQLLRIQLNPLLSILIQLVFIWSIIGVSAFKISDSKWIINIAAIFKAIIMLSIGGLGIYVAITKGTANDFTLQSFIPNFDAHSLSFIAVILFNFMGFEIVTTFASEMQNPKKQIPQAIILGGLLIAVFYLLAAFGIGVAVPIDELSTSNGLLDSFALLIGKNSGVLITIFGIMFLYTLVANLISWSLGVNYVAQYAAQQGSLPKILSSKSSKSDMPNGANIINGAIASTLVVVAPIIPSQDLFWSFFALNMVTLLLSYIMIFPSFLKLRKIDGDRNRPFKIDGGGVLINLMTYVPLVLLIVSVALSVIPINTSQEELTLKLPVLVGTVVAIIIGEIIAYRAKINNNKKNRR